MLFVFLNDVLVPYNYITYLVKIEVNKYSKAVDLFYWAKLNKLRLGWLKDPNSHCSVLKNSTQWVLRQNKQTFRQMNSKSAKLAFSKNNVASTNSFLYKLPSIASSLFLQT